MVLERGTSITLLHLARFGAGRISSDLSSSVCSRHEDDEGWYSLNLKLQEFQVQSLDYQRMEKARSSPSLLHRLCTLKTWCSRSTGLGYNTRAAKWKHPLSQISEG